MSGRDPVRRRGPTARDARDPREGRDLRSIAAPATAFLSPPAVRRAVAGYAAEQGWAPGMTAGAMREGMALALAVAGLAVQMPGGAGAAPWARTVPTTYDALQELTGLDRSGVRSTLEVLAAAGVMRSAQDDGGLALALAAESAWAPHPLLAAAPWALLSVALARTGAPVRAALVVFAELALDTEVAWRAQSPVGAAGVKAGDPVPAVAAAPPHVWLELTLKELAHRVGYHLSHVENALSGLESAGCLTRLRGAGGRALRLAAWTIGAEPPPAALLRPTRAAAPEPGGEARGAPSVPDDRDASASVGGATAGVTIEFRGIRAVMAPGDVVDVSERDATGRRVLRIRTDDGDVVIRVNPRPREP